ncbi:ceramide transfer protein-like isoform X1 [Cylas formicarius]|uniref:ceramide transfer protein-like isoform X1 n=1 Tax=Cylas formicarius TaxID=197179 RepID=UPI002958CC48|nr:ceramide transfer protein-like isoform X1 [Cylas formicarius]XP_060533220.1 ceramide transfer protein-like isoform X1 [Cylas formicarius]
MADAHSSDDSDIENQNEFAGVLSKWTNYIHGWQDRYIVLKNGTLSYYKSEHERGYGCRGALSLAKAVIKPHEFDECRFDISVNDCVWYLRAESVQSKQTWVDALEAYRVESGYGTGSETSLKRHGSTVSLQSNNQSTASSSSFKKSSRNLREKLAELETFKEILCQQVDTLQKYFDYCVENEQKGDMSHRENLPIIDFKGESITFKTTTAAVIDTLDHCAELVAQREESWRKRFEKEKERRRRSDDLCRKYFEQMRKVRNVHPGPDLEEGPHSILADDEFYDAIESGLDKMEEEQELRELLKSGQIPITPPPISPACQHKLWPEIDRVVKQQVAMARMGIGECGTGWQLFAEDGEMKMYRREEEIDGMVVDPLKAVHVVKGITGHEVCQYFFEPKYRYDWETTLEHMTVLETIAEDTLIFHQVHKRIWPASQRDVVFWSHLRQLPNDQDREGPDMWTVVNNSTEISTYPANSGKCVRIFLTVCLLCQTRVIPPKEGTALSRDNVSCKITYCSVVNPGGWAPASVLRAVYKREYPKFLKRFTAYVKNQTKNQAILF